MSKWSRSRSRGVQSFWARAAVAFVGMVCLSLFLLHGVVGRLSASQDGGSKPAAAAHVFRSSPTKNAGIMLSGVTGRGSRSPPIVNLLSSDRWMWFDGFDTHIAMPLGKLSPESETEEYTSVSLQEPCSASNRFRVTAWILTEQGGPVMTLRRGVGESNDPRKFPWIESVVVVDGCVEYRVWKYSEQQWRDPRCKQGDLAFVSRSWHHVAFIGDGSSRKVWVDGVLVLSKTLPCAEQDLETSHEEEERYQEQLLLGFSSLANQLIIRKNPEVDVQQLVVTRPYFYGAMAFAAISLVGEGSSSSGETDLQAKARKAQGYLLRVEARRLQQRMESQAEQVEGIQLTDSECGANGGSGSKAKKFLSLYLLGNLRSFSSTLNSLRRLDCVLGDERELIAIASGPQRVQHSDRTWWQQAAEHQDSTPPSVSVLRNLMKGSHAREPEAEGGRGHQRAVGVPGVCFPLWGEVVGASLLSAGLPRALAGVASGDIDEGKRQPFGGYFFKVLHNRLEYLRYAHKRRLSLYRARASREMPPDALVVVGRPDYYVAGAPGDGRLALPVEEMERALEKDPFRVWVSPNPVWVLMDQMFITSRAVVDALLALNASCVIGAHKHDNIHRQEPEVQLQILFRYVGAKIHTFGLVDQYFFRAKYSPPDLPVESVQNDWLKWQGCSRDSAPLRGIALDAAGNDAITGLPVSSSLGAVIGTEEETLHALNALVDGNRQQQMEESRQRIREVVQSAATRAQEAVGTCASSADRRPALRP